MNYYSTYVDIPLDYFLPHNGQLTARRGTTNRSGPAHRRRIRSSSFFSFFTRRKSTVELISLDNKKAWDAYRSKLAMLDLTLKVSWIFDLLSTI